MPEENLQEYFYFSPFFVDSESMSDFAWDKLQDRIDQLPANLINFLSANNTSGYIQILTQKYASLSTQGPDVARLIRDVVIGDVFIGDMPSEISRRLGIDPTTAKEIANQIVSQLFTPVLEDIKKVQAAKFPGRLPAKSQEQVLSSKIQGSGSHYQGENLPESGGNIIDLRQK